MNKHYRPDIHSEAVRCRSLRAQLALASPIILPDGTQFMLINRLSHFNSVFFAEGTHPAVGQLVTISEYLKVNGHYLCPMLIWATDNDAPVLARIRPGAPNPVKVIHPPSLYYPAYTICVLSDKAERKV